MLGWLRENEIQCHGRRGDSVPPECWEYASHKAPADCAIAHQMLDDEHLLGAGREAGDRLCQFVLEDGQPVAVQLRRFLVIEATRRPSLACQCLGLALRGLCAAWSCEHGYPALARREFQ